MTASTFDQSVADEILDLVSDGISLSEACATAGAPRRTVRTWLADNREFSAAFDAACRLRIVSVADDVLALANRAQQIAADADPKAANAAVNALRVEIDAKRWLLAKLAPATYGDRITQEMVGAGGKDLIPPPMDPNTEEGRGERQKLALALLNILRDDKLPERALPIPEPPLQIIEHEPERMTAREYREADRRRRMFSEAEWASVTNTY